MNPLKPYLYGGALLLFIGLGLSVWWLNDSLGEAKATIAKQDSEIKAADKLIKGQNENIARNNLASVEYQKQLQVKQDENEALMSRVNTGSAKLLVRAKCPAVQNVATDPGRAEPAAPELEESSRPAYFNLTGGIDEWKIAHDRCLKQLQLDREYINQAQQ